MGLADNAASFRFICPSCFAKARRWGDEFPPRAAKVLVGDEGHQPLAHGDGGHIAPPLSIALRRRAGARIREGALIEFSPEMIGEQVEAATVEDERLAATTCDVMVDR